MASRKKRKVNDSSLQALGDESPPPTGGWTPWLPSQSTEHVDAPTVKLDIGSAPDAEPDAFSSFAQLGSVLDKLESFNKKTTLSTISSLTSAIVPIATHSDTQLAIRSEQPACEVLDSFTNLVGVVKTLTFESSILKSQSDPIFEKLTRYLVPKCYQAHIISFATLFTESSAPVWGVVEIPGPFGATGYVIADKTGSEPTLHAVNMFLRNDKIFADEVEKFGVPLIRIPLNVKVRAEVSSEEENEEPSNDLNAPSECIIKVIGSENIFGFFDFLRQSELIANPWRKPASIYSNIPFKDALCLEAKISRFNRSAANSNIRVATVEDLYVPISQVDRIARSGDKCTVTCTGNQFSSLNGNRNGPYVVQKQSLALGN
jgi:hypothetical protein